MLDVSHTDQLPDGAREYLRLDNPRLIELIRRYTDFGPVTNNATVWDNEKITADYLLYFRGDNPYVFQLRSRNGNELSYALTYYHLSHGQTALLLDILSEDELFGIYIWILDGRPVSRDLLDSVTEIDFLRRHLYRSCVTGTLLDIGAEYGRLACRLAVAMPELSVLATDAVPASTFISEYYLRFRGSRARVVPLDEVEPLLSKGEVTVATNIHSFSECAPDAIRWWTLLLARSGVQHLVVVANANSPEGRCLTNRGEDMEVIFAEAGYSCRLREPRYLEPVLQRWGINGSIIALFDLR